MKHLLKPSGFLSIAVAITVVLLVAASVAQAVQPVVKTVPWVPTNPLIPHDTWSGKVVTLKGTSSVQGANFQWTWDFGDGSPVATGTVTNRWNVEATHTYTGAVGTIFTARLTVRDTNTNESASQTYFVAIRAQSLQVEVNRAIDEGLWYLHKTQYRSTSGGVDLGDWTTCPSVSPAVTCNADSTYYAVSAANVNAFLSNGHLEAGPASNPYTDTVQRGMRRIFQFLVSTAIPATQTNLEGTFNPDSNGNGIGIAVNQVDPFYQGGPFVDAIIASGTPNALTTTGGANVVGRTYKDVVQDMIDYFSYCQYDSGSGTTSFGGWRYSCNQYPDNSANQWVAIAMIAAQRQWGIPIPPLVKAANVEWLGYSQFADGKFGYTGQDQAWGYYAVTPSGMVQLALNGIGRGNSRWDKAETWMRDRFHQTGGATNAVRDYYYGLFSFTKSMLLHDSNNDGVAEPITMLQSSTAGVNPLDWYGAQRVGASDTQNDTDGVARTLVNDQNAGGWWTAHNYTSTQYPFETAWAILMLNRTVFASGVPVAVALANPNPAVAFQTIQLDGSTSFHQDPTKIIDSWEWDLDNNGTFETSGPFPTVAFPAVGNYPVKLRVTDNGSPEGSAETTIIIVVSTPPLAPTAEAGGPYNFCLLPGVKFFLNGAGSTNPDEGQSEPGQPGDTITSYAWELSGNGAFDDASGVTPDVTAFYTALGAGSYLAQLKVTDRTATSFPSSGQPNLTGTDSAQVNVRSATDPACLCVSNLAARAKPGKADLTWTWRAGAHHYNIYRGTVSGGPYLKIASVNTGVGVFMDAGPLTTAVTYYWIIREANNLDQELCQSNQASAKIPAPR